MMVDTIGAITTKYRFFGRYRYTMKGNIVRQKKNMDTRGVSDGICGTIDYNGLF